MVMKFTILKEISFYKVYNSNSKISTVLDMYKILNFTENKSLRKYMYYHIKHMKCRHQHLVTACAISLKWTTSKSYGLISIPKKIPLYIPVYIFLQCV